jgi:hypothetical protein
LKKFIAKDLFKKEVKFRGRNSFENRVILKKIESLMVNLHKSKTNDQNKNGAKI